LLEPTVVKRAIDEQTYTKLWKVIDRTADKLAESLGDGAPAFLDMVAQLREADRRESETKESTEKEAEAKRLRKEKREAKAGGKKEKKEKKEKGLPKRPEGDAGEQSPPNSEHTRKPVVKEDPSKKSSKEGEKEDGKGDVPTPAKDTPNDDEIEDIPNSPKGKKKPEAGSPGAMRKKNKQADAIKKAKKRGSTKTKGAKGEAEATTEEIPDAGIAEAGSDDEGKDHTTISPNKEPEKHC